jgi:tetratricopeptide (TPR) repeat protein
MMKRLRAASAASVALLLAVGLSTSGCGKYSYRSLKATKAYKDANTLYQAQDWRRAAERYEEALADEQAVQSNPALRSAYFFLGNSYDNLYKPSRAGEAENDGYIQKAIGNYKKAAEIDTDPKMKKLAMEYLVAAYGSEKLNDPAAAEPIVQQMIQMDPGEPAAYFQLSKIYEDAGRYEEAEQALLKAKEAKPRDPAVYSALSGFYNRQGDFTKTMEALNQAATLEPNNPEGYQRVAVFYWEKAFRDHRLQAAERRDYIQKGIDATDKALALNPSYAEAMTYKNILLRMKANEETDRNKQAELIKQADALRAKAIELTKKKAAGVS